MARPRKNSPAQRQTATQHARAQDLGDRRVDEAFREHARRELLPGVGSLLQRLMRWQQSLNTSVPQGTINFAS